MVENKRLLIIEDDPTTRRLLQTTLEMEGYDVQSVGDGPEALRLLQKQGLPHLVIMDLGLPSIDGFALSERIKRMGDVPIVVITGNHSEEAVINGMQNFADDFITKPFSVREVAVRIQRVLSRLSNFDYTGTPIIQVDEHLSIDFPNNRMILDGQSITLTPIETNLLYILVNNRGRVISPDALIARVWPNKEVFEDTLRVHMHRLRGKLEESHYIQTERGSGYRFG